MTDSSKFDDIEFPLIPAEMFRMAAGVARTARAQLPWLLPIDCVILSGTALSQCCLYRLHPTGTNLRGNLLSFLDVCGIGIAVVGGPFFATTAGFSGYASRTSLERLFPEVIKHYRNWLGMIYYPAFQRARSGRPISIREREILRQREQIREGLYDMLRLEGAEMVAFKKALGRLADPDPLLLDPGDRRTFPDDALLLEWYRIVRQSPEWNLEDLLMVNWDHTISFDRRSPSTKGRPKSAGLSTVLGRVFEQGRSGRELAMSDSLDHLKVDQADPAVAAEGAEVALLVRDIRDACETVPLLDLLLDRLEAVADSAEKADAMRFLHEVALGTAAIRDRALRGAVMYAMGSAAGWTREHVARDFAVAPGQLRGREAEAQRLIHRWRTAAAG
jgi:hypothetical protein